ncbi:MAG: hypothetical protein ACRDD8_11895 [Bacteroidales bacterium]
MTTTRTKEHKLLNKFLRENKCKRKYYRNKKCELYKGDKSPIELNAILSFISGMFSWCETPEGYEYWLDICEKWETYHNKHQKMKEELQKLVNELTEKINALREYDDDFWYGQVAGLEEARDKLVFILEKECNNGKEVKEKRAE